MSISATSKLLLLLPLSRLLLKPALTNAQQNLQFGQYGIGWCFIGAPGREINLTLEKDTDYQIRITYPNHRHEVMAFNTRGMTDGQVLKRDICPGKIKVFILFTYSHRDHQIGGDTGTECSAKDIICSFAALRLCVKSGHTEGKQVC